MPTPSHPDDAPLAELSARWCDHDSTPDQQTAYYLLLARLLRRFPLQGEFADLRGERDELIDAFIEAKTLIKEVRFPHVGALYRIYANFLKDRRKSYDHRNVLREADFTPDDADADWTLDDLAVAAESSHGAGAVSELPYLEAITLTFREHHLSIDDVLRAAARQLRAWPDWARKLLAYHFCARREAMPLGTLAARFGIASYSYRVAQLGVSFGKLAGIDGAEFAQTLFGQWLTTLLRRPPQAGDGPFAAYAFDMLTLVVQAQIPAAKAAAPQAGGPKP